MIVCILDATDSQIQHTIFLSFIQVTKISTMVASKPINFRVGFMDACFVATI